MTDLFSQQAQPGAATEGSSFKPWPSPAERRKSRSLHKGMEIYRTHVKLGAFLQGAVAHMQRGMKTINGEALLYEANEMAELLRQTNIARGPDKVPLLDEFLGRLERVEYMLESANGARVLPHKTYAASIDLTESLGRQANGLRNKFHAPASTPAT